MPTKDINLILTFQDKGTGKVRKVTGDVTRIMRTLEKQAGTTKTGFKGLRDQVDKTTQTKSKFKKMMSSTWAQMAAGLGVMMGVQGAIMMVRKAITSTIQAGREFEKAWANVTTMLTISTAETDKMREELLNLSPIIGDTTDLARGMYQVLSASIEPAKAIKFLEQAAISAQAGVTDTATAVDALTTVINAYGLQAEDVTQISDIMFQTVKRGKLTYESMAEALGTVVPIAAQVGMGFDEVGAAMATLTRQGIDVRTVTVSLRQILVSILKPTAEAQKLAKELGVEFNAQALAAKGLAGFLKDLKEKGGATSEAQAVLFGNVRALMGIMPLAGKASEGFAKDLELMREAMLKGGQTMEAFHKQMKSADFWMRAVANLTKKFKIAIWEGIAKSFLESAGSVEELADRLANFAVSAIEAGKKAGESIYKFVKFGINAIREFVAGCSEIGKAIELILGGVVTGIKWFVKQAVIKFYELQMAWLQLKGRFTDVREEMQLVELALWKLREGTAGYDKQLREKTIPKQKETKEVLKDLFTALLTTETGIKKVDDAWLKGLPTYGKVKKKAKDTWELIKELPEEIKKAVNKIETEIVGKIETPLDRIGKAAGQLGMIFRTLGDGLVGAFGQLFDAISAGWETITEEGEVNWKKLANIAAGALATIGQKIGELVSGAKKSFAGLGASIGQAIGGILGPIGKAVGGLLGGLVGGLFKKGKKKTEAERLAEELNMMVDEMKRTYKALGEISDATLEKIAKLRQEGVEGWKAVSLTFADVIADVGVNVENFDALFKRTTDIIYQIRDGLIDASKGSAVLNDAFSQLIAGAEELGLEGTQAVWDFIKTTREAGLRIASVTKYVLGQLDKIPDALTVLISNIKTKFAKFVEEYKGDPLFREPGKIEIDDTAMDRAIAKLGRLGKVTELTFSAMIAEGRNVFEVMTIMKEPLSLLLEKYEELGTEVPEFLQPIVDLQEKMELKPKLFEKYNAAITIMEALKNSAYITQESFDALKGTLGRTAKTILDVQGGWKSFFADIKAGKTTISDFQKNALLPMLTQMAQLAALGGIKMPGWAKKLVPEVTGISWKEFKDTVSAQATAAIDTLAELTIVRQRANQQVNILGRIKDRLIDVRGLLKDIFRKITPAQTGAIVRQPSLMTVAEKKPEVIQPLDAYLRGEPVKGTNIRPGVAAPTASPVVVKSEITLNPQMTTNIIPWASMEGFIIKTVMQACQDEKLLIPPKAVRPKGH